MLKKKKLKHTHTTQCKVTQFSKVHLMYLSSKMDLIFL